MVLNELVSFDSCFESLGQCVCAWINAKTCNSRSGSTGSPKRDM